MGYCLSAYAVNLSDLTQFLGSRNEEDLYDLIEDFESDFKQFDEMAADCLDDEEQPLTMVQALTQMVKGDKCDGRPNFMYGYALEFVCMYVGIRLTDEHWSAMPSGARWAETVDEALEKVGIPKTTLRIQDHIFYRGVPVPIPPPDDSPCIGYLTLAEIRAVQESLRQAKLATIEDQDIIASIKELESWLQICVSQGRDLVTFYA
ncbi:MAG: hypothetical protein AB7K24_09155 [Gemmataceae bacterium]